MSMAVRGLPDRIDLEPERVERGLAQLVLSLVELVREVLERQAVRRMESGTLTEDEVERLGLALLRLKGRLRALRELFELSEDDVTLRLGPLPHRATRGAARTGAPAPGAPAPGTPAPGKVSPDA